MLNKSCGTSNRCQTGLIYTNQRNKSTPHPTKKPPETAVPGEHEQIDLLFENEDNIPVGRKGLRVLKQPEAGANNERIKRQAKAREVKRIAENERKARQFAEQEYPGEKWKKEDDRIFCSARRKRTNFDNEFRDAQILRDFGSTVFLVPENSRQPGTKYDAIVNGMKFELKNVGGKPNTLFTHFLKSRSQAPNVFINLETSNMTRHEAMGALYSARNSVTHTDKQGRVIKGYAEKNKFHGGRIILKLKGHKNLIYLNVDDLKSP